jgi:hypothetical protein
MIRFLVAAGWLGQAAILIRIGMGGPPDWFAYVAAVEPTGLVIAGLVALVVALGLAVLVVARPGPSVAGWSIALAVPMAALGLILARDGHTSGLGLAAVAGATAGLSLVLRRRLERRSG